jgi:uncharacterized protein with GYD domain
MASGTRCASPFALPTLSKAPYITKQTKLLRAEYYKQILTKEEDAMPIYVSLVKFSTEGVTTMKDQGVSRSDAVQRNIESLGGRLLDAFYCLGEYDVVAILEFSDNKAAMKAALLNSSMGHMKIITMPALSRNEWRELLQETWANKQKQR